MIYKKKFDEAHKNPKMWYLALAFGAGCILFRGSFKALQNIVSRKSNLETRVMQPVRKVETRETSETGELNHTNKINKENKLSKKYPYLKIYDDTIEKYVAEYNRRLGINLSSDLIRAVMVLESGNEKDRVGAFKYDPLQIANRGDYALDVLANGKEHTYLIGDFSRLKGKKHTLWNKKKKCWDYSTSNMDADSSIYGGIGWLLHKAAIYNERIVEEGPLQEYVVQKGDTFWDVAKRKETTVETLRKYNPSVNPKRLIPKKTKLFFKKSRKEIYIAGWRPWEEAVRRYNGNGDPNYVDKIKNILKELKEN